MPAALGVNPDGHPLLGIRYVDERHHADARFRHGVGLGVRRTVLHAALAERAAALGIPVLPTRVTAFEQPREGGRPLRANRATAGEARAGGSSPPGRYCERGGRRPKAAKHA
jgi:hypothetical protein